MIDNVPSQANRLEDALRRHRTATGLPEFVLDLSGLTGLPAHLPRSLSSLQFPHRNADAYLRDARLGDRDFVKTDLGRSIFGATAQTCGPLIGWFPQALLYGCWQSHLGKKRANTKHARAWVSEIVGWNPAPTDVVKVPGLKGDPLNLSVEDRVNSNPDDRLEWTIGKEAVQGAKKDKLSEIGHGQVPFMGADAAAGPVSFTGITQRATLSFAQLRRISLGPEYRPRRRRISSRPAGSARAACPPACIRPGVLAPFRCGSATRSGHGDMAWRHRGPDVCLWRLGWHRSVAGERLRPRQDSRSAP